MKDKYVNVVSRYFWFVTVLLLSSVFLNGCSGNQYKTTPVPTGVAASTGDGRVTLAWTPVSGATSYRIYWSATSGVTPASGTQITNASNPYTLTGLNDGTTYYFVVTAVNTNNSGTGESAASSQASCTPLPVPAGVTASTGDGQATLAWTAVSGAASYNLYWSTATGVTPANGTKISNVTAPYTLKGLTDGTTCYFVVTEVTGSVESSTSVQVTGTPGRPVPAGVTVNPGDGQAAIYWTPVAGANSYNLYWSTTTGVTPANGTPITGATTPYNLTGLTDGTTYYIVVTAVTTNDSGIGESAASTQAQVTPSATPPPAVPTGVVLTTGDGQATIAWTLAPNTDSYNLYWSTATGVTPSTGTKIVNATNPYTLKGLIDGTAYHFVVTAVNANGESTASQEVNGVPARLVPTGVTAGAGDGKATISWQPVTAAVSYNIYWSLYPGVTPTNGYFISNVTSPFTLSGLSDGVPYYFIVTEMNGTGESTASAQVSATPAPAPI